MFLSQQLKDIKDNDQVLVEIDSFLIIIWYILKPFVCSLTNLPTFENRGENA